MSENNKLVASESFSLAPKWCGLSTMENAFSLADRLAKSSLVPENYRGKPNDILVAMFWCESLKMPITQGLQSIAVVNGRPSLYGDGALAVIRASGKLEYMTEEWSGDEKTGTRKATCRVKRVNEKGEAVREYSMDDAKRAGLLNRQTYRNYLDRMLQMRARGYALRDKFADVLMGMSYGEEQEDVAFSNSMPSNEVDSQSETTNSPEIKMPRVKRKRKTKEETKPVDVVDVVEVETVETDDVKEVVNDDEPVNDDVEVVNDEEVTVAELVANCQTINELMDLWHSMGITKDHPDAHLFSERKSQLSA